MSTSTTQTSHELTLKTGTSSRNREMLQPAGRLPERPLPPREAITAATARTERPRQALPAKVRHNLIRSALVVLRQLPPGRLLPRGQVLSLLPKASSKVSEVAVHFREWETAIKPG